MEINHAGEKEDHFLVYWKFLPEPDGRSLDKSPQG
jgi:hypothetical protein